MYNVNRIELIGNVASNPELCERGLKDDRSVLTDVGAEFAAGSSRRELYQEMYDEALVEMRALEIFGDLLEHRELDISVTLDSSWDPDNIEKI